MMDRRTVFDIAARLNALEDERQLAEMNGERVGSEPVEGDERDGCIYTKVGMTPWGTPVMRWKRWGF